MQRRRIEHDSPEDDSALLIDLLRETQHTPGARRLRPATLLSQQQVRKQALAGYRFRTWFDRLLLIAERVLAIAVFGFFCWWLYDGYGRDMLHKAQHPPTAVVQLAGLPQGATAAELSAFLGDSLPYITPAMSAPPKPADYLVPAQGFQLPPPPTATPQPIDERPFRLIVPAMNLDTPVHEVFLADGTWEVAEYAVGYHHGTALPGAGNTVLAGHAGLRGAVFAQLPLLRPGHDIYLDAGQIRYHYRVQITKQVWPTQVDVMFPTPTPVLTMITCTAWDTQRLVVVADLVDTAPLPPSGATGGQGENAP